jgi:hypothetical protein
MEEIPADAEFVLARAAAEKKFAEKRPDLAVRERISGKTNREQFLVYERRSPE